MRSLPPKDREAWVARDERIGQNARYLTQTLKERRTPDGQYTCDAPTLMQDPPMKTGQSAKGYGLDLDDGDTTTHCPHREFTGPHGEKGIDNQVARLTACIKGYQQNMDTFNRGANFNIQSGATVMLLRVTDVDNLQNSPHVTDRHLPQRRPAGERFTAAGACAARRDRERGRELSAVPRHHARQDRRQRTYHRAG